MLLDTFSVTVCVFEFMYMFTAVQNDLMSSARLLDVQ